MKIIAVVNDNTGETHAVLKGYERNFLSRGWFVADEIRLTSESELDIVAIRWGNLTQYVESRCYSFIYEEEEEE